MAKNPKTQHVHLFAIFNIAFHNLRQHRIRSGLALLGLIIGIAALITTFAIGRGTERQIRKQILSLGNNFVLVKSENYLQEGKLKGSEKQPVMLNSTDLRAIKAEIPHIAAITPVVYKVVDASYDGNKIKAYLKGTNNEIFRINDRKFTKGVPFSTFQVDDASRVAVLGYRTAKELFTTSNPLADSILIDQIPFTVIGVLDEVKLQTGLFPDQNLDIFVPYTAVQRLNGTSINDFSYILLGAADTKYITGIADSLERLLRFRHDIKEGMQNDFTLLNQEAFIKKAQESMKTLTRFLSIVSLISMAVGGIGIMNTLLVSITEKHKEIGLRMAIGAPPKAILLQYLFESIILCFFGGIAGIALGLAIPPLITYFTGLPTIVEPRAILIGVSSAVIIGLFFGLYPAWTASRLNPVDALKAPN